MNGINNPIVTKNQLIDILYEKNKIGNNRYNEVSKEIISDIVDIIVEIEDKDNDLYSFSDVINNEKLNSFLNLNHIENTINYFSVYFINYIYFKISNDKYLYISKVDGEILKEQIDYILKNNLNENKKTNSLKFLKFRYENFFKKIEESKKTLDVKFKEYDYIKVIGDNNYYNDVGIKDIILCLKFLKSLDILNIEEQIALRLIILLGIRNIYLNNSDYYTEIYIDIINYVIENIDNYILFIFDNMGKIVDENKYSADCEHCYNLRSYCFNLFKDESNKHDTSFYEKVDNKLIPFLEYIEFDYYISNKEFEKADEIFQKDLPLFYYLKDSSCRSDLMLLGLIDVIFEKDYKHNLIIKQKELQLALVNGESIYSEFQKINITRELKRNIKVLLKFLISCYYYFLHFNNKELANALFEFIFYFKDGYDIEKFIFKSRLIKLAESLNQEKIDNIDDIEEVDLAIKKLEETIGEMNLVTQFDIDDVPTIYDNINFDNFKQENREIVKTCIATGDAIINSFKKINLDFSTAVIAWSKAVETEIDEKLFSNEIIDYNAKNIIEKDFTKIDFNGNIIYFRIKKSKDITIGIFNEMEKYSNGKQNLLEYLYYRFFSQYYKLDIETYKKLCDYLKTISKPRNDSAHKGKTIDITTAYDCKDKILASEKILEILSKLEKR